MPPDRLSAMEDASGSALVLAVAAGREPHAEADAVTMDVVALKYFRASCAMKATETRSSFKGARRARTADVIADRPGTSARDQ
jgi:hypothetical protein